MRRVLWPAVCCIAVATNPAPYGTRADSKALALTALPTGVLAQIGVAPTKDIRLETAIDPKFRVGDIWEYNNRPGEQVSRMTVLKIDRSPELGIIVHVAVDNLTWRDCQNNSIPQAVPHMPFARGAVESSVKRRIASDQPLPHYEDGYHQWREAYSRKHAGVYIIGVKDAVTVAEMTYRSGNGCK
jgi:hypothetical protein